MEQAFRAFARLDREVGTRGVSDEERVAGEDDLLVDHEGAVLGPVAGRMHHAQRHPSDFQFLTVVERIEGKLRLRKRMNRNRNSVLQCEAPVSRHMVGMRVRLEHPHDLDAALLGRLEVLLDRVRRIDEEGLPLTGIADQVGGTAEIVVDELAEEHTPQGNSGTR